MSATMNLINRGALIVFEGCDRCGKSTQSTLLVEFLKKRNIPVEHFVFPERTSPSGVLINSYLTNKQDMPDEAINLLFTVNRWEVQNQMKKLLLNGITLVVDRYAYSGVAYSTAKGLSIEWCKAPEKGLIRPDLVFYLKTDIEKLSSRGQFGEERYEKEQFQKKVAEIFDEIYKTESHYWEQIDASQDVKTIREALQEKTLKTLEIVQDRNIPILWK